MAEASGAVVALILGGQAFLGLGPRARSAQPFEVDLRERRFGRMDGAGRGATTQVIAERDVASPGDGVKRERLPVVPGVGEG